MKKFYLPLLSAVFILAIACGGGGGGGGGNTGTSATSGTTSGNLNPIRVEAVLASNPGQIVDPQNIQVGEQVQFQVVGYTAARERQVLSSSGWTTTDTTNSAGTLSPSGLFTAQHATGATTFTVSGTAGSKYSATYLVKPVQALVTGTALDSNGFAASRVVLVFYNASNQEVGRVTTAFNGNFRASVPTTAKRFNIDKNSLPTTFFFRSFVYQTLRYTALENTCSAPLPALTSGTTTSIGTVTIDAATTNGVPNAPPPPPDGCPVG